MKIAKSPAAMARQAQRMLRNDGSAMHSREVQRFFKEEVRSHGWYTAPLRQAAARLRQAMLRERDLPFLLEVADELFRGKFLEEDVFAVALLEKSVTEFGDKEFERFGSWLARVSNWASHDTLVHSLIAPMLLAHPPRIACVGRWVRSEDRWHRRAAAVALIRAARQHVMLDQVECVAAALGQDADHMVQKGVGWLLRETVKANPPEGISLLLRMRDRLVRPVLRIGCETLSPGERKSILNPKNVSRPR